MNRTELNNIVLRLCKLTGYVNNRTDAIQQEKETFIYLDENFGNTYSIWEVTTHGGMRECPFKLSRHAYKAGEMATMLYALISGIEYGKESAKP